MIQNVFQTQSQNGYILRIVYKSQSKYKTWNTDIFLSEKSNEILTVI